MNYNKILAIKLRSFGDTVIWSASLRALADSFPNAEIQVLVSQEWMPLLSEQPGIHQLHSYQRRSSPAGRAKSIARLGLQLRKQKFDCVLNFHASPSSSLISFATAAATRSIHFHGHKDKNRYSTVEIPNKGLTQSIVERDLDTIRALGVNIPRDHYRPEIAVSAIEKENARAKLASLGIKTPILAIALGASRPTKMWPIDRYGQVAEKFLSKTHGSVITLGTKSEMGLIEKFSHITPIKQHSFIDLPLREIAAILSHCHLMIGNDSGPRHLAAAVGVRTITLIGPEHPLEWHPYDTQRHPYFYIENLQCRRDALPGLPSWCALTECTSEGHVCMVRISTDQVVSKLLEMC